MTQSIATNVNNDIFIGKDGKLAFVSALNATVQNCQTAMQALQGEMIYAQQNGMPYHTVVWNNYNPSLFEAAARSVITNVQDVLSVLSFTQSLNGNTLNYEAVISTIYGTQTFKNI